MTRYPLHLNCYIYRLHKTSEFALRKSAVGSINGFLQVVTEKIAQKTADYLRHSSLKRVGVDMVRSAVETLVPAPLSDYCIQQGRSAVAKYQESIKSETAKAETTNKNKPVSRASRAGLVFPVPRVEKFLRNFVPSVKTSAVVFLTAVLQYLASELLTNSSTVTEGEKRHQINANDVYRGVYGDASAIPGLSQKPIKKSTSSTESKPVKKKLHLDGDVDLKRLIQKTNWAALRHSWTKVVRSAKPVAESSKTTVESTEPVTVKA